MCNFQRKTYEYLNILMHQYRCFVLGALENIPTNNIQHFFAEVFPSPENILGIWAEFIHFTRHNLCL